MVEIERNWYGARSQLYVHQRMRCVMRMPPQEPMKPHWTPSRGDYIAAWAVVVGIVVGVFCLVYLR